MKKLILAFFLIISAVLLISCDGGVAPKTEGYTFRDALGNDVTISEGDKIAAAHASFADCWLLSGGKLVGVTSDAVEDHGLDVGNALIIGTAKSINREALVASGAEMVFLSADLSAHLELKSVLDSLGIGYAYFRVDTFKDYSELMEHFCAVTGREDLFKKNVTEVGESISAIEAKIPTQEGRTLLLMRAFSSGIKAKSDDNLAGQILKSYGLFNIADAHPSLLEDMGLEHIVSEDPDFIFVLTMGSEESALSYLRNNIESNPAFSELKSVKNGNYYVLPKELFHYKPNKRWAESYEYLAKILYPELFTED